MNLVLIYVPHNITCTRFFLHLNVSVSNLVVAELHARWDDTLTTGHVNIYPTPSKRGIQYDFNMYLVFI